MKQLFRVFTGAVLVSLSVGCSDSPTAADVPALEIVDLLVGTGVEASEGMTVTVHYTGWLYDAHTADHHGIKFDSSRDRNQPFSFVLGTTVIAGWNQGIVGMKVGGRRVLTIPSTLAYGASGSGGVIPPNSALVFDIELLNAQ